LGGTNELGFEFACMDDICKQLTKEIDRVKREIEEQKKLIKKHAGQQLMVETAETEMKALHTRLSVLEANLAKHSGTPSA
jgi:protein subunit release factor A